MSATQRKWFLFAVVGLGGFFVWFIHSLTPAPPPTADPAGAVTLSASTELVRVSPSTSLVPGTTTTVEGQLTSKPRTAISCAQGLQPVTTKYDGKVGYQGTTLRLMVQSQPQSQLQQQVVVAFSGKPLHAQSMIVHATYTKNGNVYADNDVAATVPPNWNTQQDLVFDRQAFISTDGATINSIDFCVRP